MNETIGHCFVAENPTVFENPLQQQLDRIEAKLDQLLAPKKKPVARKSKDVEYPRWFDQSIWLGYPHRSGSNPKKKAYNACNARLYGLTGRAWGKVVNGGLVDGMRRYKAFCDATGKTGTEYVMMAATFFGPDKHYENDWTIPTVETQTSLPKNNDDLMAWAKAKGYREPSPGESYPDYRNYLQGKLR